MFSHYSDTEWLSFNKHVKNFLKYLLKTCKKALKAH